MTRKTLGLDDTLHDYLLRVGLGEHPVALRLRQATAAMPEAQMQIGPEQGALMAMLVELTAAKRCLEIGVFTGYSALVVALALAEEGRLVACDVDKAWTDIARRHWREAGVEHKIDLHLRPAVETLDALLEEGQAETFDLAFIDADKERYEVYYERCLRLLRPGGLIIVDNVLWGGRVADAQEQGAATIALRAFNEARAIDARVSLAMLPITDGVSLLRKR